MSRNQNIDTNGQQPNNRSSRGLGGGVNDAASRWVTGTPRDVLCGRGFHIMNHHGNLNLHLVINKFKPSYSKARRHEKAIIIGEIIREVQATGARFLKRVKQEDGQCKWEVADYECAYEKVSHALRLQRKNASNKIQAQSSERNQVPVHAVASEASRHQPSSVGQNNAVMHNLAGSAPNMLNLHSIPSLALQMAPAVTYVPVAVMPFMGIDINVRPVMTMGGAQFYDPQLQPQTIPVPSMNASQSMPLLNHLQGITSLLPHQELSTRQDSSTSSRFDAHPTNPSGNPEDSQSGRR